MKKHIETSGLTPFKIKTKNLIYLFSNFFIDTKIPFSSYFAKPYIEDIICKTFLKFEYKCNEKLDCFKKRVSVITIEYDQMSWEKKMTFSFSTRYMSKDVIFYFESDGFYLNVRIEAKNVP